MSTESTDIEVLPRKAARKSKAAHEELLAEIRRHVEVPDDYHPVVTLAALAHNSRLPLSLQIKAHAEVATYVSRKLKPVDAPPANAGEVPELMMTLRTKPTDPPK